MAAAAFDEAAARAFGTVAGPLRTAGRKKGARVSEVLIEATPSRMVCRGLGVALGAISRD
jgi:hypothetical protein